MDAAQSRERKKLRPSEPCDAAKRSSPETGSNPSVPKHASAVGRVERENDLAQWLL